MDVAKASIQSLVIVMDSCMVIDGGVLSFKLLTTNSMLYC